MRTQSKAHFNRWIATATITLATALLLPSQAQSQTETQATLMIGRFQHDPSQRLLQTSRSIAKKKIPYVFGGTTQRGMDCSASIQHLFRTLGVHLPRTSEAQANHLARSARLWRVAPWEDEKTVTKRLQPGDLLFWTNQGNTAKIGHVMMYVGTEKDGSLRLWGARGTGKTGLSGSGVDYFNYRAGGRKRRIVAYGRPALQR